MSQEMSAIEQMLTVKEVAWTTAQSPRTIRRLIDDGVLRAHIRPAGTRRRITVPLSALREYQERYAA